MRHRQQVAQSMAFIELRRGRIHFLDVPAHGDTIATAVVLHGFSCDHRLMTGAFEPVFSKDGRWRRIYLDLPGHGLSDGSQVSSTDEVLAVVAECIEYLDLRGPVVLVGESFGGYLVQGLLAARPDFYAGVCLVAPAVIADHSARSLPTHQVLTRPDPALEAINIAADSAFALLGVVTTYEAYRRTELEVQPGIDSADTAALERISAAYRGWWEGTELMVTAPAVVIAARQDAVVGYADQYPLARRWPRATYAALDRAGHNLQIEQAPVFTALVEDWVARVEESLTPT